MGSSKGKSRKSYYRRQATNVFYCGLPQKDTQINLLTTKQK